MDLNENMLKLYHESHSLVRHHVDSFDHFIDVEMKKIVKTYGQIELRDSKYFVEFSNVNVEMPTINEEGRSKLPVYPNNCRIRNLTYAGNITADVRYPGSGNKVIRREKVLIGRIPMMLKSKRCHLYGKTQEELIQHGECCYDTGGYFITRGTERVFLMQEQMAKNRMIIEKKKITRKGGIKIPLAEKIPDSEIICYVVSDTVENKSKTTVFKNNGYFYVQNSLFHESVPLFIAFAALNMAAHKDIFESVGLEGELQRELLCSAREGIAEKVFSQQQALRFLVPKMKLRPQMTADGARNTAEDTEENRMMRALREIQRRLLNHVDTDLYNRAQYLGFMVRRILLAEQGRLSLDDRDFYGVKRVDPISSYLGLAFDDKFQTMVELLRRDLEQNLRAHKTGLLDPCSLIKEGVITDGLFQCLYTGNWRFQRFAMNRCGVTQVLNRLCWIATLGHLGRITSQFEKVRKITGARAIHPSQFGYVCVADTPEGEACGLVKNLAFLSEITSDLTNVISGNEEDMELSLRDRICEQLDDHMGTFRWGSGMWPVMLDGVPLGWTKSPHRLASALREQRRMGVLHRHVSVCMERDTESVAVCSDGGRLVRPFLVLDSDGRRTRLELHSGLVEKLRRGEVTWDDLVSLGVIEYLDAREGFADCLVAVNRAQLAISSPQQPTNEKYTHMEIDPATVLGTVASIIPFPHHNQSPRNTYQCAMGKQALGVVAVNQRSRFDGTQHVLVTPQKPLTLSGVAHLIDYHEMPAGQNPIVAVTCFGGHDVEDALIINEASIQRGMFRSITNKVVSCSLKENEMTGLSSFDSRRMTNMDNDGTPSIGSTIANGDVLISKFVTQMKDPMAQEGTQQVDAGPKPCPIKYAGLNETKVTAVVLTNDENGYKLLRVQTTQIREPEVGDKLSSRHGQKGVIGRVVPAVDMPVTEDGIVPDLIMNPHGFPSRMTVGKLIELLANKAAALDGKTRDSSAFVNAGHVEENSPGDSDYTKPLFNKGFSTSGKETYRTGTTGKIMSADLYIGPVYYQRLRHMVQDKVHARSNGKVMPLTRQPVVGRSQDGGLRVGEMERDCLIGYGATQILKERMLLSSDPFRAYVCEGCGLLATSRDWCQMCRSSQKVSSVIMPYATKLLLQELMTMQIKPKLTLARNEVAAL